MKKLALIWFGGSVLLSFASTVQAFTCAGYDSLMIAKGIGLFLASLAFNTIMLIVIIRAYSGSNRE